MGVFGVNILLLYGEGEKAFARLQEEIMKGSDDHSLFAWKANGTDRRDFRGLLADSPVEFPCPATSSVFEIGKRARLIP